MGLYKNNGGFYDKDKVGGALKKSYSRLGGLGANIVPGLEWVNSYELWMRTGGSRGFNPVETESLEQFIYKVKTGTAEVVEGAFSIQSLLLPEGVGIRLGFTQDPRKEPVTDAPSQEQAARTAFEKREVQEKARFELLEAERLATKARIEAQRAGVTQVLDPVLPPPPLPAPIVKVKKGIDWRIWGPVVGVAAVAAIGGAFLATRD